MGTTPNGLPYPEPTEDLRLGAEAIQALAEATDAAVFPGGGYPTASGRISINPPAGSYTSASVTFPAGLFDSRPNVVCSAQVTNPQSRVASVAAEPTATSVLLAMYGASSGAAYVYWVARQDQPAPLAALSQRSAGPVASPPGDTIATCHTEGCPNADIPLLVTTTWVDEDGNTQHVGSVICGVCEQPITDLKPSA